MANTSNLRVAVIGGGPGGYAAAFLAADLGMKVTLIDPEVNPGGVCLHRGCIPSKALLHVAKLLEEAEQAKNWGIEFGEPKIDLNKLRGWKESIVKKLTGGLGQLSNQRSVQFVQGKAAFVNSTTLKVTKTAAGGEENLTFDRIIIATGSRPTVVPSLKLDSPRLMDSTGALDLPDIPRSPASTRRKSKSMRRDSSRSTSSARRPTRRSMPSATSPENRCSRTKP